MSAVAWETSRCSTESSSPALPRLIGRNTPTRCTRRANASTRPRATEDLPVCPSGEVTYTLVVICSPASGRWAGVVARWVRAGGALGAGWWPADVHRRCTGAHQEERYPPHTGGDAHHQPLPGAAHVSEAFFGVGGTPGLPPTPKNASDDRLPGGPARRRPAAGPRRLEGWQLVVVSVTGCVPAHGRGCSGSW